MHRFRTLFIRVACAVYDALILFALWILATALWIFVTNRLGLYEPTTPLIPFNIPFDLYIFGISYLYLGGLWRKTGQTLGMRAWKLKVVAADGSTVTWLQALTRTLAAMLSWALLGAGWLWILFDREQLALHDRLSGTQTVRVTND